ncbi:putative N-formylglutamate amidohydrolase [Aliiruegeria haliotis]|uniref:Putative N-formylglutamate amidohydrolase n=1 Tax=Aliiruegeria haliotis TaxID=1280846 RepID=A0A2T0RN28_9RHOB|nr:N-formylglutamate amidohydrolase [Aliiruegeria haliotis]PRY22537.1 putative N-formylglutamate amidohydrolase [Aliiruegeria haliotis]
MSDTDAPSVLTAAEGPAVQVENPDGRGQYVVVCEHASRFIPAALNGLGLDDEAAQSHAAWDIGALDVARQVAMSLDAPLVASRVSRLVYDCNRPPEAGDAITEKSERFEVPGNHGLTDADRDARVREIYLPFRDALARTLDARSGPVTLITIHSFTPVYMGKPRDVELGLLHDADSRVAEAMMRIAREHTSMRTELNAPYAAADGVTHTLRAHAVPAGLPNVMIEIRSDLIDSPEGAKQVATELVAMLNAAMDGLSGVGGQPTRGDQNRAE